MGIAVSLLLFAVGAIPAFAVSAHANGVNIHAVGWILMAVGGARALPLTLLFWSSGRGRAGSAGAACSSPTTATPAGRARRTVVEEDAVLLRRPPYPASAAQRVVRDVAGDARVLLQPADRVRVPVAAEGDVDPQPVAAATRASRLVLPRGASGTRTAPGARPCSEQRRWPRRPATRRASRCRRRPPGRSAARARDEVRADRLVALAGDLRRLDVDPLADPHVGSRSAAPRCRRASAAGRPGGRRRRCHGGPRSSR